jgi:hypothetical protein
MKPADDLGARVALTARVALRALAIERRRERGSRVEQRSSDRPREQICVRHTVTLDRATEQANYAVLAT